MRLQQTIGGAAPRCDGHHNECEFGQLGCPFLCDKPVAFAPRSLTAQHWASDWDGEGPQTATSGTLRPGGRRLLCLCREYTVPLGGRRPLFEPPNSIRIGINQADKTEPLALATAEVNHFQSAGPILLAVTDTQHGPMVLQRSKLGACSNVGAADNRINDFRFRLSLHPNGIDLEQSELLGDGRRGSRPDEDRASRKPWFGPPAGRRDSRCRPSPYIETADPSPYCQRCNARC